MRDYCRDLEARMTALAGTLDDRTLECLAFAEARLLWIHPFEDFNGRVTRAFLAELLQRLDIPALDPTPDPAPNTERYLQALNAADHADWGPLVAVWRGRFEKRLRHDPSSPLPWPTANGVRYSGLECRLKRHQ